MAKAKARIRGLLERSNVVVIVSHDMEALARALHPGPLDPAGRLVDDGPIDEVIDRYLGRDDDRGAASA